MAEACPLEPMMASVLAGSRRWWVEHGNSLYALRCLPDNCIDSMVTDPPGGISFMGRAWDGDFGGRDQWIDWLSAIMREAYRVLKPGAHILVWSIPRTSHWTGMAIENAGFEMRDNIDHLFASGMPKSHNVSKAFDKAAGAERAVVGSKAGLPGYSLAKSKGAQIYGKGIGGSGDPVRESEITAPATDAAKQWDGWGTALKPAHEIWWLARKPLIGTIVQNVLEHGTGAINIDGTRVAHASAADLAGHEAQVAAIKARGGSMADSWKNSSDLSGASDVNTAGRWPANLVLSHSEFCQVIGSREVKANPTWATPNRECESTFTGEEVSKVQHTSDLVLEYQCADGCPVLELDRQAGTTSKGGSFKDMGPRDNAVYGKDARARGDWTAYPDQALGTASRFFHQFQHDELDDVTPFFFAAKPARSEKEKGLDEFEASESGTKNPHPTPKGRKLMQHFCKLVTPPGGVVLDLFCGSGSTGVGALLEGFRFIGVELNDSEREPFASVARARLAHIAGGSYQLSATAQAKRVEPAQASLFSKVGS